MTSDELVSGSGIDVLDLDVTASFVCEVNLCPSRATSDAHIGNDGDTPGGAVLTGVDVDAIPVAHGTGTDVHTDLLNCPGVSQVDDDPVAFVDVMLPVGSGVAINEVCTGRYDFAATATVDCRR